MELDKQKKRLRQMRHDAKKKGKFVPTYEALEAMVPPDMKCKDCDRTMNWFQKEGSVTVATLQHYRDGSLAIVCFSCNSRHSSMPGDSFLDIPKGHKLCCVCKGVKEFSNFHRSNTRRGELKITSRCKVCCAEASRKWQSNNRDKYNEQQRVYRAKRKAEGNPIKSSWEYQKEKNGHGK